MRETPFKKEFFLTKPDFHKSTCSHIESEKYVDSVKIGGDYCRTLF